MAVEAALENHQAAPRPAFSLETVASPPKPAVPLHAWAMVTFAMGSSLGVAVGGLSTSCILPAVVGATCLPAEVIAVGLGLSMALAAGAWWALPSSRSEIRAVRSAGQGAVVAGAGIVLLTAASLIGALQYPFAVLPALAAAPAAMLLGARPDARLSLPGHRGPPAWIRAGAGPSVALFVGAAVGLGALDGLWMVPGDALFHPRGPGLAAALFLVGGALILRSARSAASDAGAPMAKRVFRPFSMTPMQRHAFLAEVAIVAAMAGSATAVLARPWFGGVATESAAAILLGGVLGALAFALLSPGLDHWQGRGRLLSLMPLFAGIAPLLLVAEASGGGLAFLLGAAALFAFVLASSPQRYALAFDLCPSKGRLRAAMDFQGAKLAVASLLPIVFVLANRILPAFGLLLLSALGLFAFAVFASTLGALGRRTL